jgi:hypothetical protein
MFESDLEMYPLKAMKIIFAGNENFINFSKAILYVDTADIELSWFVDLSDIDNAELLENLSKSVDIRIMMYARTESELEIAGEGFLHPNLASNNAAIKGDGELIGYEQIREIV